MASKSPASAGGRRIQTRRSGVHGKGVFALQDIPEGETIIEYKGEVISWEEALRRHPHDPSQPNHTFYFHIDDSRVIDGNVQGNASRWINHACEPNCEADEDGGRVFIKALRNIVAGEELNYDYGLIIDEPYTDKLKAEFACRCGTAGCRGTLLAPKEEGKKERKARRKEEKKLEKKARRKAEKTEARAQKDLERQAKQAKRARKKKTAAANGEGVTVPRQRDDRRSGGDASADAVAAAVA